MGDEALIIVTIVLLLLGAAFMAMAETSISRISKVRAHHLMDQGRRGADRLLGIVNDPAPYLNIVLLLTLVFHITATALATGLAISKFGSSGEAAAAAIMTFVIFIFAEVGPKTFTVVHTERAALFMARPIYVLGSLLQPLGKLLILIANAIISPLPGRTLPKGPFITEDEIRHLVDVAEEEAEIAEDERELIHSVFEFGDSIVREVMVPRPDMVTARADASLGEVLETIIEAGYSRIPIYEGDIDNIVGVLYAKDVLKRVHESESNEEMKVSALARAPLFVPELKKLAELLKEMQTQRVHMAIVIDEYGGTAGLVTIEDLIEEIVGEIVDEYDQEEPLVEPIDDSTIRVDAKMSIDEVNELLGVNLPDEEWDTVGGLLYGLMGRVPLQGETVTFDSLEFRTERVVGRRIQKVVITKTAAGPDSQDTEA
jgi:CBS domain containing-hemolysin-like protein